ncbi:MAG TPA: LarC family nickel insertion protein [Propionibacteriaceae bacterium]|nr:LarC family nickel insertion protein [Propionibacteriaceae bacterium]
MTHLWLDVTAGVSGDMVLGALLDAGAPLDGVQAAVDALVPGAVRLTSDGVTRAGQRATKLGVTVVVDDPPHRTFRDIRRMLAEADLADLTRTRATAVFERLAEAEARAHGIPADEVHFHEVGALDSIADVVGVCEAVRLLRVATCSASPVALGSGRVRVAHGDMPVPVPAVAELTIGWRTVALAEPQAAGHHQPKDDEHDHHEHGHRHSHDAHDHGGHTHDRPAPVLTRGALGELATPTGMALIRTLASTCEAMPAMVTRAVGVGAGGRDVPQRPNVVRAFLGDTAEVSTTEPGTTEAREVVEVMANVDDQDPRLWPGVLDRLLAAGALDAWLVPIHMKKGRPAFTVHALVTAASHDAVVEELLEGTTTLGVREVPCSRFVLDRTWRTVDVLGRPLTVKVASRDGRVVHAAAEFDSLADVARAAGVREHDVAVRAVAAMVAAGITPGSEVTL